MANCTKNSNCRKNRFTKWKNQLPEYYHIRGSVNKGTFFQFCRYRFNIRLNQNDIIWSYNTRKNIYQIIASQSQQIHIQICRNQTRIKVHCNNKEAVPETSLPHLLLCNKISHKCRCNNH